MTTIAVKARNVIKAFGPGDRALRALNDVSVQIRAGEFFTLLGPSGCGKNMMIGNFIELQFGHGCNRPLGAALSMALLLAVMRGKGPASSHFSGCRGRIPAAPWIFSNERRNTAWD